ncbi:hypothetical protein [Bacillus paranthracis]|uniref:hypothetical protein n=1 Tax=Bacillus paranthracis TaxID=2026186 RepID=UPI00298CAC69|nr:hypothetical protein [Bacillus paranthracis]
MFYILKLTNDQINTAIELYKLKETDIVSDENAEKAYKLYKSLHNKPDFKKANDEVKPLIGDKLQPLSPDLFKNPARITYLTNWVIKILPFIDLLSETGNLPLSGTSGYFIDYVKVVFKNYFEVLKGIHEKIPSDYNIIQDIDFDYSLKICKQIVLALEEYYNGYPHDAYEKLQIGIEDYLLAGRYLDSKLTLHDPTPNILYKMRVGTNHIYSSDEMFHIPFDLRHLVSTNRYSIPGLPCVYLGSSALTCWEEMNKPDLNSVQTSLFFTNNINYLDLSIPPGAAVDDIIFFHNRKGHLKNDKDMEDKYKELKSYIVMWPLIAACSIRVKNSSASFKPEYIIPQLLLQWTRKSEFDGICYFSTKLSNYSMYTAPFYKNFAFPVQEKNEKGHCAVLREKFTITNAVPWQMFQLYKGSYLTTPSTKRKKLEAEVEFVEGMKLLYSATDFYKLENFLENKYEKEKL